MLGQERPARHGALPVRRSAPNGGQGQISSEPQELTGTWSWVGNMCGRGQASHHTLSIFAGPRSCIPPEGFPVLHHEAPWEPRPHKPRPLGEERAFLRITGQGGPGLRPHTRVAAKKGWAETGQGPCQRPKALQTERLRPQLPTQPRQRPRRPPPADPAFCPRLPRAFHDSSSECVSHHRCGNLPGG